MSIHYSDVEVESVWDLEEVEDQDEEEEGLLIETLG